MPYLKWTEKYNCHSLYINGLFKISIDWDVTGEGGFTVKYGNLTLKKNISDLTTAKRIALGNVAKRMTKAMADIATLRDEESKGNGNGNTD